MSKTLLFILCSWLLGLTTASAETFSRVNSVDEINSNDTYIFVFVHEGKCYQMGAIASNKVARVAAEIPGIIVAGDDAPEQISFTTDKKSYYPVTFTRSASSYKIRDIENKGFIYSTGKSTDLGLENSSEKKLLWTITNENDVFLIKSNEQERYLRYSIGESIKAYKEGKEKDYLDPYIYKLTSTETVLTPQITVSESGLTFNLKEGEQGVSRTLDITAENLTEDISVSVTGEGFSADKTGISKEQKESTVTVTFSGNKTSAGTLTLSSGTATVTVALSATVTPAEGGGETEDGTFAFSSSKGYIYVTGKAKFSVLPELMYNKESINTENVVYSSSDPSVADVSEDGELTVHSLTGEDETRTTVITAKVEGKYTSSYTLSVTNVMYTSISTTAYLGKNTDFVILGQKEENSFGVLDLNNIDSKDFAKYKKEYDSAPERIFGKQSITYIEGSKGNWRVYRKSGETKGYLIAKSGETPMDFENSTGASKYLYNIENDGGNFAIYWNGGDRYLSPYYDTKEDKWGLYKITVTGENRNTYREDGKNLHLYRKSLSVMSDADNHITLSGEWDAEMFKAIDAAYPEATDYDLTTVYGNMDGLSSTNRNCMFIVSADVPDAVKNQTNVIVKSAGKYTAQKIVIADGAYPFHTQYDIAAASVSVERNFNSGKASTLCLPFEREIPDGCSLYELTGYSKSDGGIALTFCKPVNNKIEAYKPYIIKAEGQAFTSLDNVTIKQTPSEMVDAKDNICFTGTMVPKTLLSDDNGIIYGFSNGGFGYVGTADGEECYINPTRAYLVVKYTDTPVSVETKLRDVTTSIETTHADNDKTVNVYSPDGRIIKKGVKKSEATRGLGNGMYIIGNEKVIIR